MSREVNLKAVRYIRQVSNGCARAKYSYLGMQEELLQKLKNTEWRLAKCTLDEVTTVVNKVAETDAEKDENGNFLSKPSFTSYLDDKYDFYKQSGDANKEYDTMCGYAGCVCYKFILPQNLDDDNALQSITLDFTFSRYLRSGVKIVANFSDDEQPNSDWNFISMGGDNCWISENKLPPDDYYTGVNTFGLFGQQCITLLESRARDGKVQINDSWFINLAQGKKYLYVYLTIADYTDYWYMYDTQVERFYSIEGSGQLIASTTTFKYKNDVDLFNEQDLKAPVWIGTEQLPSRILHTYSDTIQINNNTQTTETYNTYAQETIEAVYNDYGNWCFGSYQAIAFTSQCVDTYTHAYDKPSLVGYSSIAKLLNLDNLPRKDFYLPYVSRNPNNPYFSSQFADKIEIENLNCFSKLQSPPHSSMIRVSGYDQAFAYTNNIEIDLRYSYQKQSIYLGNNGGEIPFPLQMKSPHYLRLASNVFVCPHVKNEYNYMTLNGTILGNLTADNNFLPDVGINIWKTSSPDAIGIFGDAIISEFLGCSYAYTATQQTITAELQGTGAKNSDKKLTMIAEFVDRVMIGKQSTISLNVNHKLNTPLKSGEMIILTPYFYGGIITNSFNVNISLKGSNNLILY